MDYFIAKRPLDNDVFCGDTGIVREFDHKVFAGIVDVLGHGERAHKVAVICEDFLKRNYREDLVKTMKGLHEHIRKSRGAVAGLCRLDLRSGDLKYVGIGDTVARTFGSSSEKFISRSGVIGYMIAMPRETRAKLHRADVLLLYTDGVKAHFVLEDYPDLPKDDARTIATRIIEQFGKEHDDALCIALKYGNTQMIADEGHR